MVVAGKCVMQHIFSMMCLAKSFIQNFESHTSVTMKYPDTQFRIVFIIMAAAFLSMPFYSCGQISKKLLTFLPDSCRPLPANKSALDVSEMTKIFQYAEGYVTRDVSGELDSLAKIFANKGISEKNDSLSIMIFNQLANYSQTAANFNAAAVYCGILLDKTKGKLKFKRLRCSAQKTQGALYASAGNYEESIRYFNDCLAEAKADGDSIGIAEIYSGISYPYNVLGLYELSISSLDSSIAYFGHLKWGVPYYGEQEDVLISKCGKYISLYETTGNNKYGQKAQELIDASKTRRDHHSMFNIYLVAKIFLDGNYQRTLFLCDSLQVQIALNQPPYGSMMLRYINKYRALSYFSTGRIPEGVAILAQLVKYYSQKKGPYGNASIITFSEKLYHYYNNRKQWKNALTYLEINKSYRDSLNLLENRGKVFEFEQKYNFSKKETRLRALERNNILRSKERDLAVFASVVSFLVMIVVFILLFNRNRKLVLKRKLIEQQANSKIDRLRIFSELQIAELEERSNSAQLEDRKRLGMELHDDLAGSLASVNIKLGTCIREMTNEKIKNDLEELRLVVLDVYNSIREKSHQWFNRNGAMPDSSYTKNINNLLQTALPADKYQKEVVIDDECLHQLSLQQKIELLYIIREGVTNIIKHSNACKIMILIYRDIGCIMIEIKDNGKGFAADTGMNGIGLQSIKNRAAALNGQAEIFSDKNGTEIKITIPDQ